MSRGKLLCKTKQISEDKSTYLLIFQSTSILRNKAMKICNHYYKNQDKPLPWSSE